MRKCVTLIGAQFTLDRKKAASNAKKHGVSFVEAASLFADPLAAMLDDELDPERAILVGHAETGRVLLVVFIEQPDETFDCHAHALTCLHRTRLHLLVSHTVSPVWKPEPPGPVRVAGSSRAFSHFALMPRGRRRQELALENRCYHEPIPVWARPAGFPARATIAVRLPIKPCPANPGSSLRWSPNEHDARCLRIQS